MGTSPHVTPTIEDRAVAAQAVLADRGQHRMPSIPDVLNAAAIGELAHLTVLHLDQDYELADLTGQPVERQTLP
jgi:predicted nucleic acid-binding protein